MLLQRAVGTVVGGLGAVETGSAQHDVALLKGGGGLGFGGQRAGRIGRIGARDWLRIAGEERGEPFEGVLGGTVAAPFCRRSLVAVGVGRVGCLRVGSSPRRAAAYQGQRARDSRRNSGYAPRREPPARFLLRLPFVATPPACA